MTRLIPAGNVQQRGQQAPRPSAQHHHVPRLQHGASGSHLEAQHADKAKHQRELAHGLHPFLGTRRNQGVVLVRVSEPGGQLRCLAPDGHGQPGAQPQHGGADHGDRHLFGDVVQVHVFWGLV
mgnify:CR=1 FL=1